MRDYDIPGLSGRPRIPQHLLTQMPTNLAATPLTRDKTYQLIESLIASLQRLEHLLGAKTTVDKDDTGWTIRIEQTQ